MSSEVKLVIHDGDGNLYDTIDHITRTTVATFGAFSVDVLAEDIYQRFSAGVSLHNIFEELEPSLDPQELEAQFYHFDHALGYHDIRPNKGLFSMLLDFAADDVRVGVASNRELGSTLRILRHLEITEDLIGVDFVACPPEHPSKPDPSQLNFLMEAAGVSPSDTIMVGDTPGDILAGKNALVRAAIGFTAGFASAEALAEAGADILIDDLALLPDIAKNV